MPHWPRVHRANGHCRVAIQSPSSFPTPGRRGRIEKHSRVGFGYVVSTLHGNLGPSHSTSYFLYSQPSSSGYPTR